jgi:hypothetical protein
MADKQIQQEHLEQVDRHIAETRQRISGQQQMIKQLEKDGHDTAQAKALLAAMLDVLRTLQALRQTLLDSLGSVASSQRHGKPYR